MKIYIALFVVIFPGILAFNVTATTHYVNASSASPASPYTSWATAAAAIQDAVDISHAGDSVIVTDGVYNTGGRANTNSSELNRVIVTNAVAVQSVHGPAATMIVGFGASRCVYLVSGATLNEISAKEVFCLNWVWARY